MLQWSLCEVEKLQRQLADHCPYFFYIHYQSHFVGVAVFGVAYVAKWVGLLQVMSLEYVQRH